MFEETESAPRAIDPGLAAAAKALNPGEPSPTSGEHGSPPGGASPGIDYKAEAVLLVEFLCTSITPFYPSLVPIYTPEKRAALAGAVGGLLAKYQLDFATVFAKWEPELKFAFVAFPLIAPTAAAVRADLAEARAKREQASQPEQKNPNAPPPEST